MSKVGRPSVYNDSLVKKANDYINNFSKYGDAFPQIARLARILGVRRETLYAWSKDENKQEFSNILEQIMAEQELSLVNNGISGEFNSTITKMMLTKHGYSDKMESSVDHTTKGESINKIERVIVRPKD